MMTPLVQSPDPRAVSLTTAPCQSSTRRRPAHTRSPSRCSLDGMAWAAPEARPGRGYEQDQPAVRREQNGAEPAARGACHTPVRRAVRRPRNATKRARIGKASGSRGPLLLPRTLSAIRPWTPGSGVRAVHGPWVNRPRTGTDRPTDGHGPAHGRERKRPRTGPGGAVMQTALTRIPALTCHFRMPALCRRRPRHRGLARCPGCRGPRRCAGWLRWPGRRCSGRRS